MKLAGVPLAGALLSCCFSLLVASSTSSVSGASASVPASSSLASASSQKPKRDAGLSYGGISSYHGPSHKYLPPAYENHLSFGSLSGNPFGAGGYSDYQNNLKGDTRYGHHYGHGYSATPSYASSNGHGRPLHPYSSSGSPKIETYIVQTSGGSSPGHNYHGHGHSISHGISHGISHEIGPAHGSGLGYKYAPSSNGAYLNLLGNSHKTSTYVVATPDYGGSSHGIGYGSGPVHRPSYGGHLPSHGYGNGFGHGISHQNSDEPSHGNSHGLDHSLEHALESGLSHALGLGHSSVGQFAQHPFPQHAEEHSGYSYDAPATPFGKGNHLPLSSYGVPLIPGYDHQESLQEPVQVQVLEQEQKADRDRERETPAYALGHKGLGHFSYTASKPQALHTDVLSSVHSSQSGAPTHSLDLSKAPFKPSAFLGAKHESGSNSIGDYDYATPSSSFAQAPSSPGYDYSAPGLYGPPGHPGDSVTPIFEPEATYLPPASSYGPPASSSHGYH